MLWKKGKNWKAWKERYFVLHGNHLSYFKSSSDKEPIGTIVMEGATIRTSVDEKRTNCFTMMTASKVNSRDDWQFSAETEEERDSWIEALKKATTAKQNLIEDRIFDLGIEDTEDDLKKSKNSEFRSSAENKSLQGKIRQAVSKKKRRFIDENFDLDLTYVTDRIIAMGFPAEGTESVYRNKMEDVVKFMEAKHLDHYKIYNLCAEKCYNANKFKGRVAIYPFEDHNVPPMNLLIDFCRDAEMWLRRDPLNIIAVHCLAGKGRTGVMICSLLLHFRKFETSDQVLGYFGIIRTENGVGITNPCQKRYIRYYEQLSKGIIPGIPEEKIPKPLPIYTIPLAERKLEKIRLKTSKDFSLKPGSYNLYANGRRIYNSKEAGSGPGFISKEQDSEYLSFWCQHVAMSGDIKLEFLDDSKNEQPLFSLWFHVSFIEGNVLGVCRREIDGVHKEKHKAKVGEDFAIQLQFDQQYQVFKESVFEDIRL